MSVSSKVKAALHISGKKQIDLAENLDMVKQTLNNKMSRDSWTASDLINVAEFTGCKLAFVFPDGTQTVFSPDDMKIGKSRKKKEAPDADTSEAGE